MILLGSASKNQTTKLICWFAGKKGQQKVGDELTLRKAPLRAASDEQFVAHSRRPLRLTLKCETMSMNRTYKVNQETD
jgi:hypothetical protein